MSTHSSMALMLHPNFACPFPSPSAAIICSQLHPAVSSMVKDFCGPLPFGALVSKVVSASTRAKRFTPSRTVGTFSGMLVSGHRSRLSGTLSPSESGGVRHLPALPALKRAWISVASRARLKISTSSIRPDHTSPNAPFQPILMERLFCINVPLCATSPGVPFGLSAICPSK